jgi:hypothetical protein
MFQREFTGAEKTLHDATKLKRRRVGHLVVDLATVPTDEGAEDRAALGREKLSKADRAVREAELDGKQRAVTAWTHKWLPLQVPPTPTLSHHRLSST